MTKIKDITIDGLRGVKSQVLFNLDGNRLPPVRRQLLGKSCVSDSLEWFLYNKIEHLTSEEIIELEALRNICPRQRRQRIRNNRLHGYSI